MYIAIDTRTGKEICRSEKPLDRGFISEAYDIAKTHIEIKQK